MKKYGLILSSALLIAVLIMHGQEAAPPSVDLFPEQEEEPSPTPPPNGPELPELKQLDDSFKPKSLGKEADALQVHALWRQLKNRTVNDPDVQAAKKYAQAAPWTDLEKRKRLSDYYEVYYKRMSALATTPELKVALQALKDTHQAILAQPWRATIADAESFLARRRRRPQARRSRKRKNTRRRKCASSVRFAGSGWRRLGCGFCTCATRECASARLPTTLSAAHCKIYQRFCLPRRQQSFKPSHNSSTL